MHRFMIAAAAALTIMLPGSPARQALGQTGGYAPRLGDMMTLMQIRHAKLWFAGNSQNWELAAFELGELAEDLEGLARFHPKSNEVALGPVISTIEANELSVLKKAVAAKDRTQFRAAYDRLTGSCNACHQATRHGFIVIQRPRAVPLSNQAYAPAGRGTRSKTRR